MARKSIRVKKANPQTPAVPVDYTLESIAASFTATTLAAQIPAEGFTPEAGFTVAGSFVDDGDIVITKAGGGLGAGPDPELQFYSQFGAGTSDAEIVPLATNFADHLGSALVLDGGVNEDGNTPPGSMMYFVSEALSKGSCWAHHIGYEPGGVDPVYGQYNALRGGTANFTFPTKTVRSGFASINTYSPPMQANNSGGFIGRRNADGSVFGPDSLFPQQSSWKQVWWLTTTDNLTWDMTTTQYSSYGNFTVSGGNGDSGYLYESDGRFISGYTEAHEKYKFGAWHNWQHWFDEPPSPYFDEFVQTYSRHLVQGDYVNQINRGLSQNVMFPSTQTYGTDTAPGVDSFPKTTLPGWLFSNAWTHMLFDDIYLAWGANCAARVEIHNAELEANATIVSVCPVWGTDWSDGQLTLKLRMNKYMPTLSGMWLKIYDRDNNHIVVGRFT